MATTYLTLVNNTLNELNESELTSSTFSSSRGIQTSVKKFVLKSMHELYNALSEIPDLYKSTHKIRMPVNELTVYLRQLLLKVGI